MYKYNLHYLLRQLSIEDYEISQKFFPEALKISKWTWRKWIYCKKDDSLEIRPSQLILIATFFNCKISDIINTENKTENLKAEFEKYKNENK